MKLGRTIERYLKRTGFVQFDPKAVLFDMDGILYDSMPLHAKAWKQVCDYAGIDASEEEFFAYEGRTGASTIDLLFRRQFERGATVEECNELYKYKSRLFSTFPAPGVMPGAQEAVSVVSGHRLPAVLVTGSGQGSLLERLNSDYDGAFSLRVTAYDVKKGKPDPEPFLVGIEKAGVRPWQGIGVDNAPLGVTSSSKAGLFTIGVRTGPLPEGTLEASGADIELNSMFECAEILRKLL